MRLSSTDGKLLAALQLRADATVPTLTRFTGLRAHTVHYAIKRFTERKMIRPWPFLDPYRLGFTEYQFYFALAPSSPGVRTRVLGALTAEERVVWMAELGGDFQYGATVVARFPGEAAECITRAATRFGGAIRKKSVVSILSFTLHQKRYLNGGKPLGPITSIGFGPAVGEETLDSLDQRLVSSLYQSPLMSMRERALHLSVARGTVEARLAKLRERGILKGYVNFISARELGMQTYKLLLAMRGVRSALGAKVRAFCDAHPHVVSMIECLGSWDFEITIEVHAPADAVTLVEEISSRFANEMSDIHVLPIFHQTISTGFFGKVAYED